MEYNNTDYLDFIMDSKNLFYSQSKNTENSSNNFCISSFDSDTWEKYSDEYWTYMIKKNDLLPNQGWKIHITAAVEESQSLLFEVSSFLIKQGITFKFVPSKRKLILRNSKYGDRIESGKFITIYPKSTEVFLSLLVDLSKLLESYGDGPYILNDQQWSNSNVFYRYGAFKKMMAKIDGKNLFALQSPTGKMIEDMRVPYYTVPDFVEVPPQLIDNENDGEEGEEKSPLDKFDIKEALHFSNAGGVYLASLNKSNVVLKEGRPNAGVDANGQDGFQRIKQEANFLRKLKDMPEVVNYIDYFISWKHNYLCEEYIDGVSLSTYITDNYVFDKNNAKYAKNMIEIISQLVNIVKNVHKKGVAIGDLQPENIMISSTNGKVIVRILDLEAAKRVDELYLPGIATPGFVNVYSKNYESADWFALFRISRYVFLPIESGIDLAPSIEGAQNVTIKEQFGSEVLQFLLRIEHECQKHMDTVYSPAYYEHSLDTPKYSFAISNLKVNKQEVLNGILNHLDFGSSGLIHGDIKQYEDELSHYSVANGAFGALMVLNRTNAIDSHLKEKINVWLNKNLPLVRSLLKNNSEKIGLFSGFSGIFTVLYELGYVNEAVDILYKLGVPADCTDVSIYSGLAGLGLASLSMYQKRPNKYLKNRLDNISQNIIKIFDKSDLNSNTGLLEGWLGAVLFLALTGEALFEPKYKEASKIILDEIIGTQIVESGDGVYLKNDELQYQRLMPYLNQGSAGLGVLLLLLRKKNLLYNDEVYFKLLKRLLNTNDIFVTYMGGLFDGFLGLLEFDNFAGSQLDIANDTSIEQKIRSLNNYMIGQNDEVLMPGRFGYKCSMDLVSGSLGLLSAIQDVINTDTLVWFPVFKETIL